MQRQPVTDSLLIYLSANLNEAYAEKKILRAEIKRLSEENEALRGKLSDKT